MSLLPISVYIITLNEEKNIEGCLKSLDFCEEKIVVDSGSTDRTREIAERLGARIYLHPFKGYGPQKQWAHKQCTKQWVISLDADERATQGLREFLYGIDLDKTAVNGFEVRRRHFFLGRRMGHSTLYPDYKLRIVRRDKAHWDERYIHEKLSVEGSVKKIPYEIIHLPWKNSRDYFNTQFNYAYQLAKEKHACGKSAKISDLTLRPVYTFFYRYFFRLGMLDGFPGFVVSSGGAIACFIKYLYLWEMDRSA